MADGDFAMGVMWAVKGSFDQTCNALRQMKTPQAAFEEKQSAANHSVDQALRCHRSAQSVGEQLKFRDDILRLSVELHQLEQDHQATLDAKNKDYEDQRRLVIENLCRLLFQAIGPDLFLNAIRNLTDNPSDAVNRTSAPANQPTPPATEAESEVVSPVEHPVRSPPASPEIPVRAGASSSPAVSMRITAKHGIYC